MTEYAIERVGEVKTDKEAKDEIELILLMALNWYGQDLLATNQCQHFEKSLELFFKVIDLNDKVLNSYCLVCMGNMAKEENIRSFLIKNYDIEVYFGLSYDRKSVQELFYFLDKLLSAEANLPIGIITKTVDYMYTNAKLPFIDKGMEETDSCENFK